MKQNYKMFVQDGEFVIENYNIAKPFASFLPSIAGVWGKPIWVFYVNRGQCISSFGTKDKNGAIVEFVAANKAWRLTSIQGFRTFIKINNNFYEPFRLTLGNNYVIQKMYITSHTLKIEEINEQLKLHFIVEYFTLPNEDYPALVRILHIKNLSNKKVSIESLDGLPIVIPYGLNDFMLKNISRLAEGWYSGVLFCGKKKVPIYKLLVEPVDEPEIIYVEKANFYYGVCFNDTKELNVKFVVDPDIIFGPAKDYTIPVEFMNHNFSTRIILNSNNKTPCAFGYFTAELEAKQELCYYSVVGNIPNTEYLYKILPKLSSPEYYQQKMYENKQLVEEITNYIYTKSGAKEFDGYCRQTFLDNLLRGGLPVVLGSGDDKKIFYVFSRVHGDMEREYNNFVITPEYFSQGNGHYRDVNQNRRNDIFFVPEIKDESIIYFMNLIQLDGYNPLLLMETRLKVKDKKMFYKLFDNKGKEKIKSFISKEFTLGELFEFIEQQKIKLQHKREQFLNFIVKYCEKVNNVFPLRGYWSDHWHYNIDLIENYLAIYPDELENLMFNKQVFTFYDNPMIVLPRDEKYVLYDGKPRQMNAVYLHLKKQKLIDQRLKDKFIVRTKYGKGKVYKTTLFTKLLCLVANKYALLDHECVGVEMEADRPNWCDALNGLPGLFGSSTAESLELKRLILFLLTSVDKCKLSNDIKIPIEIFNLLNGLYKITVSYLKHRNTFKFWDQRHNLIEKYRRKTIYGISGKEEKVSISKIKEILQMFNQILAEGIKKAIDPKTGLIYTYFENEVVKYKIIKDKHGKTKTNHKGYVCIRVLKFKQKPLPYFLEGFVHYLRVVKDKQIAKKIHNELLKSELYDKKLKMLKLNVPLRNVSMDIGRIKVFTPGWLENESVWLHMEYKYLLELLKNSLIEEFWSAAKTMLVPFMNPTVYGRSIFENSSFIVSSAHPEKTLHGQGFVGRLSGSTAEFISMWILITSGNNPFFIKDGQLYLKFEPKLPFWLFTEDGEFEFKFLGKTNVVYVNKSKKDTYGENKAEIKKLKIFYTNGQVIDINGSIIPPPHSYNIRDGMVSKIIGFME